MHCNTLLFTDSKRSISFNQLGKSALIQPITNINEECIEVILSIFQHIFVIFHKIYNFAVQSR